MNTIVRGGEPSTVQDVLVKMLKKASHDHDHDNVNGDVNAGYVYPETDNVYVDSRSTLQTEYNINHDHESIRGSKGYQDKVINDVNTLPIFVNAARDFGIFEQYLYELIMAYGMDVVASTIKFTRDKIKSGKGRKILNPGAYIAGICRNGGPIGR